MTARSQKPGPGARGPSRPLTFSRPVDVRRLPEAGSRHEVEASEAERAALGARRLNAELDMCIGGGLHPRRRNDDALDGGVVV